MNLKNTREKNNTVLLNALALSRTIAIVTFFAMLGGVWASFLAEPFEQEVGVGTTILGYNRDFLVNSRWWFAAAAVLCLLSARSLSIMYARFLRLRARSNLGLRIE